MVFSKSRPIRCLSIELQDKQITRRLVWQAAAARKAGRIAGLSRREMPLLRSISSYVGGELNSPLPLSCSFNLFSVWMLAVVGPLVCGADNRLRKISLSTFSIQEDRGVSWTGINTALNNASLSLSLCACVFVCLCVCVFVDAYLTANRKQGIHICFFNTGDFWLTCVPLYVGAALSQDREAQCGFKCSVNCPRLFCLYFNILLSACQSEFWHHEEDLAACWACAGELQGGCSPPCPCTH